MPTLAWFQRDLRLASNPMLNRVIERGQPIIAVYVHSPDEERPWAPGGASRWWLHHSLKRLAEALFDKGIRLHCFHGASADLIPQLAEQTAAEAVYWTRRSEPSRIAIEQQIVSKLQEGNVEVEQFSDNLLQDPEHFMTATGDTPYRVFTPFYKRFRSVLDFHAEPTLALCADHAEESLKAFPGSLSVEELGLLDAHDWHKKLGQHWTPGEASALQVLERFVGQALGDYATQRDFPAVEGTSLLSPYLHFGEISARQVLASLMPLIQLNTDGLASAAESFLRQLVWREFARYILWHYPETANHSMDQRYAESFWHNDAEMLERWQKGQTGIPIVDAGMRQLWESGWMHNRVRMLVASLLTKNMGIHWLEGARWFWDTLVDADLANNSMGWQWVAGSGVDAAPYFRIFNPQTQTTRFDADHSYINQWLDVRDDNAWLQPAVDLSDTRKDALERYDRVIRKAKKPA